ncbi:MAG: hypothetical protein OIF40_04215 [Mangrovicoccus sp.]|nr:hypothetical protein [Mangrovicoccus sp.]
MDRTQVITALALLLFGSFVLGFLTHWIVTRLSRVSHRDLDELDNMAEALHQAEETRDTLMAERHKVEHESKRKIHQLEVELRGATEAMKTAQADAKELRAFIAEENMKQG